MPCCFSAVLLKISARYIFRRTVWNGYSTVERMIQIRPSSLNSLQTFICTAIPDSCLYFANLGLELVKENPVREKFEKSENPLLSQFEMLMYANIGTALAEQRNDALAVKMTLKALKLAENSKDKYAVDGALGFVAEVYQFIGEPGIAIGYLRKRDSLGRLYNRRMLYSVMMGTCFFDKGDYDSTLHYLTQVDPVLRIGRNHLWSYPHLYLGKTYAKKLDYVKRLRIPPDSDELCHSIKLYTGSQ